MSSIPRPLIIKIDGKSHRLDRIATHFIEDGFQVVKAPSVKEGIKIAQRSEPHLIIVVDNLKAGLNAEKWLVAQHSDSYAHLVMTPLLILASAKRLEILEVHELPDRVKILPADIDPVLLSHHAKQLLTVWGF